MSHPFLVAMFFTTLILLVVTRLATERLIRQHHGQKRDFFQNYSIRAGDIVFAGDSLTDGARWDELFPGKPIKNRGINADMTTGLLERIEDITTGKPAAIFILIGTNDLPWYEYRSDAEILHSYQSILEAIRHQSPSTCVFVQSILPRDRMYASRIKKLNPKLQALAQANHCQYIDLYTKMTDEHGGLRHDLTNDNLHLLAGGYQIWEETVRPFINQCLDDMQPIQSTNS
jgi:hexosaminidase